MKKILSIAIILTFFVPCSNAAVKSFKTYTPFTPQQRYSYNHPYNNHNYYNNYNNQNIQSNSLSELERRLYRRSYTSDLQENRIARLEQKFLGSVQTGDLQTRYERLQNAINNNSNYNNNYYYQQPAKRQFWSNVANFFSGGSLTGYTPQIQTDTYGYQNQNYDTYGNYNNSFYDNQNSAGVTILD